jgi:hypothetical protein
LALETLDRIAPWLLQMARHTPMAILLEMNRVEPSHMADCTPPACRLREAIIVGVEAVATRQEDSAVVRLH